MLFYCCCGFGYSRVFGAGADVVGRVWLLGASVGLSLGVIDSCECAFINVMVVVVSTCYSILIL